ncbi:DUF6259 domain-containing protein [Candidatus Hydrogenedentota bacterium]
MMKLSLTFSLLFLVNAVAIADGAGTVTLEGPDLKLTFDAGSGYGLKELSIPGAQIDLLAGERDLNTLFLLEIRRNGRSTRVTQADAKECIPTLSEDKKRFEIAYSGIGGFDLSAKVIVELDTDQDGTTWKIEINGDDKNPLKRIYFPYMAGYSGLGESPKDDVFAMPVYFGLLQQNPFAAAMDGMTMPSPGHAYPGGLSMQFVSLYDKKGGFYLACEDTEANVKTFRLGPDKLDKSRASLSVEHFFKEDSATSFATEYPIRLRSFHGDWYDSADIYREWTVKQEWCARKLEDREDYPEWFKGPIPVFDYRNYEDKHRYEAVSPEESEVLVRNFLGKTKHPYVLFAPGWELNGPWRGPEFLPPRGGEEGFERMISNLHNRNNRFMHMFCVSIWSYPLEKETELYRKLGAPNRLFMENGDTFNLEKQLSYLGRTHRMCPATDAWQSMVEQVTRERREIRT